jgi:hypothetical protein
VETAPTHRTLLDEWRWRLDILNRRPGSAAPLAKERARVLDFLIHRYRDSPEAQRPAPASPRAEFQVNQRAIVVLHHIWEGRVGGVKTPQEAQARVAAILRRISPQASDDEPEPGVTGVLALDHQEADAPDDPRVYSDDGEPTASRGRVRNAGNAASQARNLSLPGWEALQLYRRIVRPGVDDVQAAEVLTLGGNRAALNYALYAWRELIEAGRTNKAWWVLHRFLATPEPTGAVIETVREFLAHDSAKVRWAALDILCRIGTLEDIGLLDDLLALPSAADEHPQERAALLRTMRSIAETTR